MPSSTIRPSSSTIRRSSAAMVESRCAIATTVLPAISVASASWIAASISEFERRGRLVEDQDRGILQDHPGDGDALALAAGELDAALADLGVIARRPRWSSSRRMKSCACARRAARSISACDASGLP